MASACPLAIDATRRHPIHRLDGHRFVIHGGRDAVIMDIRNPSAQAVLTTGSSLGAIAVTDDGAFMALGEQCSTTPPRIVVFASRDSDLPKEVIALYNGAQQKIDALDFSRDGTILASVSGRPDFLLTLWDWKSGDVILRSKAFSQEIYTVKFSRFFDKQLITSGTSHIRFWTLADTFTGTKLQGELGRFGKVELADVPAFAELENGDVVSGTDSGELLLWRECLVQAVFRCPGGKKCHDDAIRHVELDMKSHQVITAASDGCIKFWAPEQLLHSPDAEVGGIPYVEVIPLRVVDLKDQDGSEAGKIYRIESLIQLERTWVVFLASGGLLSLASPTQHPNEKTLKIEMIWDFPSGKIGGLVVFEKGDCCAVAAGDGTICLYAIEEKRLLYKSAPFSAGATCMGSMLLSSDLDGRHCIVGFEDGTVRVLKRCLDGWKLISAVKPHKAPVIAVHALHESVATVSQDGSLFFFSLSSCNLLPLGKGAVPLDDAAGTLPADEMTAGCLAKGNRELYHGTRHGKLFRIDLQFLEQSEPCHANEIQQFDCSPVEIGLESLYGANCESVSILAIENMFTEGSSDPWLIVSLGGRSFNTVIVASLADSTFKWVTSIDNGLFVTCIRVCASSNRLILGSKDGIVCIGRMEATNAERESGWHEEKRWMLHDSENGAIVGLGLSMDHHHIVSVAHNGTLFSTKAEMTGMDIAEQILSERRLPLKSQDPSPEAQDIIGRETYSIDEAQSKMSQELAEAHALQKKKRIRRYMEDLREQFYDLKRENAERSEDDRLPDACFEVDDHLSAKMQNALKAKIAEARRIFEYDLEKQMLGLKKLRGRFFEDVAYFAETLSAIKSPFTVTSYTIKTMDMSLTQRKQELQTRVMDLRNGRGVTESLCPRPCHLSTEFSLSAPDKDTAGDEEGLLSGDAVVEMKERISTEAADRKRREERIRKHEETKPSDDAENEEDAAAIRMAKETIGEWKFKTDHDYTPSPEERKHPVITEYELIELEEEIDRRKKEFNATFRTLKTIREQLLDEIRHCDAQVNLLCQGIGTSVSKAQDAMAAFQQATEASEGDKMKQLSEETQRLLEEARAFLENTEMQTQTEEDSFAEASPSVTVYDDAKPGQRSRLATEFEIRLIERRREYAVQSFDARLYNLAWEKLKLDCDLKHAEIVRAVKRKELQCLDSLQEKEDGIEQRLGIQLRERQRLRTLVNECEARLDARTKSDTFPALHSALLARFYQLVPDEHPHRDYFMKRFLARKENNGSPSEASCDESSDSDEEDSVDNNDDVDDAAVEGVDKELALTVGQLRDERLQMETKHAQYTKEVDTIRKERDLHSKKLKTVDASLTMIQAEMQQCQREKQAKLNEIRVAVVLRPSQMASSNMDSGICDPSIVAINRKQLDTLAERPKKLEEETLELKSSYQSLKRDGCELARDKQTKTRNLADLEMRLEEMQMLRFGQVIDLDELDRARENRTPRPRPTTTATVDDEDVSLRMELKRIELEIQETEKRLMEETKTNTELLESVRLQRLKEFEMEKARQKRHAATDLMERNENNDAKTKSLLLKEKERYTNSSGHRVEDTSAFAFSRRETVSPIAMTFVGCF